MIAGPSTGSNQCPQAIPLASLFDNTPPDHLANPIHAMRGCPHNSGAGSQPGQADICHTTTGPSHIPFALSLFRCLRSVCPLAPINGAALAALGPRVGEDYGQELTSNEGWGWACLKPVDIKHPMADMVPRGATHTLSLGRGGLGVEDETG